MKLNLFTIPYELHRETSKINSLFENGLECLHIRKPGYSYSELAKFVKSIDKQYYNRVILYDHYSLAAKMGLKGIHIEMNDYIENIQARFLKIFKPSLLVITSIRSVKDTKLDLNLFDYYMLGPLFTKFSEEYTRRRFEQMDLRNAVLNSPKEIVAMGGIELKNIEGLKQIGLQGVAVQASVWKSENVLNAFQAFQMSLESTKTSDIQLAV